MEKGERSEKKEVTDIAEELFDITSVHWEVRSRSSFSLARKSCNAKRNNTPPLPILCNYVLSHTVLQQYAQK